MPKPIADIRSVTEQARRTQQPGDGASEELETRNSQLKRMYANLALEDEAIKAVLKKL